MVGSVIRRVNHSEFIYSDDMTAVPVRNIHAK